MEIQKILEYDITQIALLLTLIILILAVFSYYFKYKTISKKYKQVELESKELTKTIENISGTNSDYRRIVERSNDGIVICVNNQIEFINESAATILERNYQSFLGKSLNLFIAEEVSQEFNDVYQSVLKDVASSAFIETEFNLGWGEIKYVEMSLTHILFEAKGAILAIFRDVSQRKKTEKKLKENEILYRNLFEHAGDAIFIMDGNEFVDCNQKTLEMFRCTKGQILKQPPYVFSPEKQLNGELSKIMSIKHLRAAKEGNEKHFNWLHKRQDGEEFHAEVTLSLLPLEDKTYILAIVRDVDTEVKYKQQIEENNIFMSDLLDAIPSPVSFFDSSCSVLHSNKQFDNLFLLDDSQTKPSFHIPAELKNCMQQDNNLINHTQLLQLEIDNQANYYQVFIRQIYRNQGNGYIVVMFNITENINKQHELETLVKELNGARNEINDKANKAIELNEKLLESEQSLKQLNSMKDKFLSIIAHDLKNPLGVFLGITSFLKTRFDSLSSEEIADSINDLYTSADKLLNLLDNLLNWARSQTGRMEYQEENTDLGELAMTVEYLVKENAKKKGIIIENKVPNDYFVLADRNMLSTVIRNLVANSIKYTDSGGKVIMEANIKDGKAIITISDTGVGMEQKTIEKLFVLGEKISTRGTRAESGTGLGLLLVKEFVDRHLGTIEVESVLGKGTAFRVSIPTNHSGDQ